MIGTDLTQGKVSKTLLKFTVPFLIANILHTLYGIVDIYVVGQFADARQLSAVTVGTGIMMMANCMLQGLGTGGTVAVGQMIGAKRDKDLQETISTIFCMIPAIGLFMMAVLMAVRGPLLRLMNTPAESFEGAYAYLTICLIGLIFTALYSAISGVLRGMGDSKGPTIFVSASCVFNIIGDVICVGGFHMGAAGAALATSAAQGLSVVIGYFYLRRRNFPFDFKPRSFRIYPDKLKMLFRLSLPTAIQEAMTSLSFLVLEAIINAMGYIASAAAGVADRVFNVAIVPALAFSAAISAMVAQNTGAGQYQRSRKCLRIGVLFGGGVAFLLFLVMLLFPEQIIGIFSNDANVVANGVEYMTFYKYDCFICSVAFCVNGYINGVGRTRYTMVVNLVASLAVRLPVVYFISRMAGATLYHIGLGMPSASLIQLAIGLLFVFFAKSEREHRKAAAPRLAD